MERVSKGFREGRHSSWFEKGTGQFLQMDRTRKAENLRRKCGGVNRLAKFGELN